jgi:hypothetical protein
MLYESFKIFFIYNFNIVMEETKDQEQNQLESSIDQIQISTVSNKLYFTCAYCSRVGDTINILNKCNKCSRSFCSNCLIGLDNDEATEQSQIVENNKSTGENLSIDPIETLICKFCSRFEHKIQCYNCSNDAQDKICNTCLNVVCENCYEEIDCICKEGIKCTRCRSKKFNSCEVCGTFICNKQCSKQYCYTCSKACSSCLIKCGNCKLSRCFDCDKAHQIATCFNCKNKMEECSFCTLCSNNYCEECLITCACCLITSCNACYKNHVRNVDKCEDCDKSLCCNECANPNHDYVSCQYCGEESICIKTYKISCPEQHCEESVLIELCCGCNVKPTDLIKEQFNVECPEEHNLCDLNARFDVSKCCKKVFCKMHVHVHRLCIKH